MLCCGVMSWMSKRVLKEKGHTGGGMGTLWAHSHKFVKVTNYGVWGWGSEWLLVFHLCPRCFFLWISDWILRSEL